jgi:hypothetical protein
MECTKKTLLAACAAVVLGIAVSVTAAAQEQEGLVNVNVSDVDVGVVANVQVPVSVAANVCGVAVNVLGEQETGRVECEADAQSAAENEQFMNFAEDQGQAEAIRAAAEDEESEEEA